MKKLLNSTTALGMSLVLSWPVTVQAQNFANCRVDGEGNAFPCMIDDVVIQNEAEFATALEELNVTPQADTSAAEQAAQAEADSVAAAQAEADRVAAEQAAQADADTAAAEQAAQAEADRVAAEQAAQAEADSAAAEQAAQAEADRVAAEQAAQAEADRAAAEQAAQAEADRVAAEQAAQAEADRVAAEQAAQAEADRVAAEQAAQAQAEADNNAAAQAEADAAAQAEADAAAQAEADAAAQAEADAAAQIEADAAAQAEEERLAAEAQAEADRAALREARRAERQAELDAAAAAAAGDANGEVVTEQVTEEAVRSSDEEFQTAVTGDGAAVESDDDDGLSKFEKALLLGLGAVVVGSVLKNGDKVLSRSGDRVVVEDPNGDLRVLKDDDALIRRPGDEVTTETFNDGSSRNIVTKPDGSRVITIRGRDGTVLRRVNVDPQGNEYVLFDDLTQETAVVVNELPQVEQRTATASTADEDALRLALQSQLATAQERQFSLRQVRDIRQVRALAPELELDAVRFETGSAAIRPEQARSLANIGSTLARLVAEDPRTVILVEGHTDAVGDATYNLALSDRRAETVALALTEYFDVPPENMITQGYGESALKVPTETAEQANRRAVVRNITSLLR